MEMGLPHTLCQSAENSYLTPLQKNSFINNSNLFVIILNDVTCFYSSHFEFITIRIIEESCGEVRIFTYSGGIC